MEWEENGKQRALCPYIRIFLFDEKLCAARSHAERPFAGGIDLRDYGKVEPVLDQNPLGICWAIAANSAAASP